jgi:hypothetical protein
MLKLKVLFYTQMTRFNKITKSCPNMTKYSWGLSRFRAGFGYFAKSGYL